MLNYIWFGLMAVALVVAAVNGTAEAVTRGAVEAASTAVQIAIGLVGIMTLWLGMMRVAEAAGLVSLVGRALRPLLRWIFPDVPPEHPAAGAIVLALAANMLGLNNAATPLGIKAMEELQTLNPDKDTATNAMVTLMAITTAGVQLIPASMIGVLAAAGSTNPTARGGALVIRAALDAISVWAIPVLLVSIPLAGIIRKVKVYDVFIDGAKEGFDVAVKIIPFLVGILVAIGMFRGSGAMDLVTAGLRPLVAPTGFPPELVPLAILRSLTGSGSLAFTTDLIKSHGPDSLIARTAATMYGSSETTFYVLAVYFGAVGVRRTRHAVPAALIADLVAAIAAVVVCAWMF
jgi:spore maturation protein SpmA